MKKKCNFMFVFAIFVCGNMAFSQDKIFLEKKDIITLKEYIQKKDINTTGKVVQTAIRTLKSSTNQNAPVIKLVGVVHIGEKSYYENLQNYLSKMDLVLFEGVGRPECLDLPDNTEKEKIYKTKEIQKYLLSDILQYFAYFHRYPKDWNELEEGFIRQRETGKVYWLRILNKDVWGHAISFVIINNKEIYFNSVGENVYDKSDDIGEVYKLPEEITQDSSIPIQALLADALGLAFQLNYIRYDSSNFQHCDISIQKMYELIKYENKENAAATEQLEGLATLLSGENKLLTSLFSMGGNMIRRNPSVQNLLKYVLINLLTDSDEMLKWGKNKSAALDSLMNVVLNKRNEYIIEEIKKILQKSNQKGKNIAVFYGAAHLAGIENALKELDYKCVETEWFSGIEVKEIDPQTKATFDQVLQNMQKMNIK